MKYVYFFISYLQLQVANVYIFPPHFSLHGGAAVWPKGTQLYDNFYKCKIGAVYLSGPCHEYLTFPPSHKYLYQRIDQTSLTHFPVAVCPFLRDALIHDRFSVHGSVAGSDVFH